jgi:hypothetical protein
MGWAWCFRTNQERPAHGRQLRLNDLCLIGWLDVVNYSVLLANLPFDEGLVVHFGVGEGYAESQTHVSN